jgi:uncharacterized protein involved in outer membrane biogenesis
MPKLIARITVLLLGLVVGVLALGWVILASPIFSEMRRSIVASTLSDLIGQELLVEDDVRVVVGPVSHIYVSGVKIPSETIEDTTLANLDLLEFDLDLVVLLQGRIDLDNLKVDGMQVNLLTQTDGTTSWTPSAAPMLDKSGTQANPTGRAIAESDTGILEFLSQRTADFSSVGLTIEDEISGFTFVFNLDALSLAQLENGARVGVTGAGEINGQDFRIEGDFPRGNPFTTLASFGDMEIALDGTPISAEQGGGYAAAFRFNTGEFGDFLDIIGLERVLEGSGDLTADVVSQRGLLKVDNLKAAVSLEEGQFLSASGSAENLLTRTGLDLQLLARLYPKGKPPRRAAELKDIKLTGIETHIVSQDNALEFKSLNFATNAFDQGLEQVGPVKIGRIHRTPAGTLAMDDISLKAGPKDAPYLDATGGIGDVLQLKDLAFQGRLAASADLILHGLEPEDAAKFGGVEVDFIVDDAKGHLGLTELDAHTVDTELWSLAMTAALGDVMKLQGISFALDLDIAESASFLKALKLKAVDAGALEITASAEGTGTEFSTTLGLAARSSRILASLSTSFAEDVPVVRGKIDSDNIALKDLQDAMAAVKQLASLSDGTKKPEVQPLVLPKEENDKDTDVQPLVLPKGQPAEILDLEALLTKTDLAVAIDIRKISGQQGVSSVSSDFAVKQGKARFGPLEVTYGGGYFRISASADLVNSPRNVSVSGATSGWDFGEILKAAGLGIDAHGKLRGNFDVTGNLTSVQTYINSMRGTASISMSNGGISTSLLELAGLGIFPWLFSEELRQRYTDIVCVVAPVQINAGRVTSNSIVAETASVQLVAKGEIDWKKDRIALRAEPRRVGKPLARSAWPFDVTGQLSAPTFKLDVGGSRSRRSDGADQMPANRKPCVPDMRQLQ